LRGVQAKIGGKKSFCFSDFLLTDNSPLHSLLLLLSGKSVLLEKPFSPKKEKKRNPSFHLLRERASQPQR
jgi:hypothetical protein